MIWLKSVFKVVLPGEIIGFTGVLATELKSAGIPLHCTRKQPDYPSLFKLNQPLLLVDPVFQEQLAHSFPINSDQPVFIMTDDERWQTSFSGENVYLLPLHTHPLEVARLLVEKLNLNLNLNKKQYAFSFFNF